MTSSSGPAIPEPVSVIVENLVDMAGYITDVATSDPLSGALVALGTLLFAVSFGVFGYLTLGAAVDLIVPEYFSESTTQHG